MADRIFNHDDLLPDGGSSDRYGVTFHEFASAVCLWASLQPEPPSIAQVAASFHASAALVCDALRSSGPVVLRPAFEVDPAKMFVHFVEDPGM